MLPAPPRHSWVCQATLTLYLGKLSCLEYVGRQLPSAQGCHPTKRPRQAQSSP